jgi:hypothetical protein
MVRRAITALILAVLVASMLGQVGCKCGCGKRHLGPHQNPDSTAATTRR